MDNWEADQDTGGKGRSGRAKRVRGAWRQREGSSWFPERRNTGQCRFVKVLAGRKTGPGDPEEERVGRSNVRDVKLGRKEQTTKGKAGSEQEKHRSEVSLPHDNNGR